MPLKCIKCVNWKEAWLFSHSMVSGTANHRLCISCTNKPPPNAVTIGGITICCSSVDGCRSTQSKTSTAAKQQWMAARHSSGDGSRQEDSIPADATADVQPLPPMQPMQQPPTPSDEDAASESEDDNQAANMSSTFSERKRSWSPEEKGAMAFVVSEIGSDSIYVLANHLKRQRSHTPPRPALSRHTDYQTTTCLTSMWHASAGENSKSIRLTAEASTV